MRTSVAILFTGSLGLGLAQCSLNPQPLPPDTLYDSGFGGLANPTVGNDDDDAGTDQASGSSGSGSSGKVGADAGQTPPFGGADASVDGAVNHADAATAHDAGASHDAAVPDDAAIAHDGQVVGDARAVDSAAAHDSGTDAVDVDAPL